MKKLLVALLLLASCAKNSSVQPVVTSSPTSTLIAHGSLDVQSKNANIASLGIINYRSSYELCGTSGEGLSVPIVLPMSDSLTFPNAILQEGDSLSAEVEMDSTVSKNYSISLIIKEDVATIDSISVPNIYILKTKFAFHNGSRYQFIATAQ